MKKSVVTNHGPSTIKVTIKQGCGEPEEEYWVAPHSSIVGAVTRIWHGDQRAHYEVAPTDPKGVENEKAPLMDEFRRKT